MRKRKSTRGLILATVNLVVILAAALIVQALKAGDFVPSSSLAVLPDESEFTLASLSERRASASRGSSSVPLPSPSSATDALSEIVGAATIGQQDSFTSSVLDIDPLWYGQSHSAFAPLVTDSELGPLSGTSLGGYGASALAPAYGRRSGLSGGYSGMGGGFPSSGGGRPSTAQNSQLNTGSSAGLGASSDGPTASIAGAPLLPAQAQGNPFFAGGIPVGGPAFPLVQFPGLGAGGAGALNAGGNLGASASVTQLQAPVSVPEPSTTLLLGCGLALAAYRNRRRLPLRS